MVKLNEITNNHQKIIELFNEYFWGSNVFVDNDGVNCYACQPLSRSKKIIKFPIKFGVVIELFNCGYLGLKSLQGGPLNEVETYLCDSNRLMSLEGCPKRIGRYFSCCFNNLTSLVGMPQFIRGGFDCYQNPLTSLEGLAEHVGTMRLSYSTDLPLLRLLKLSSDSSFQFVDTPEGSLQVSEILRKYCDDPSRTNILACQKELIDNGFEGNASW